MSKAKPAIQHRTKIQGSTIFLKNFIANSEGKTCHVFQDKAKSKLLLAPAGGCESIEIVELPLTGTQVEGIIKAQGKRRSWPLSKELVMLTAAIENLQKGSGKKKAADKAEKAVESKPKKLGRPISKPTNPAKVAAPKIEKKPTHAPKKISDGGQKGKDAKPHSLDSVISFLENALAELKKMKND